MGLCKTLGGMTFNEMLDRMSSEEIAEWIAFNALENEDYQNEVAKSKLKGR